MCNVFWFRGPRVIKLYAAKCTVCLPEHIRRYGYVAERQLSLGKCCTAVPLVVYERLGHLPSLELGNVSPQTVVVWSYTGRFKQSRDGTCMVVVTESNLLPFYQCTRSCLIWKFVQRYRNECSRRRQGPSVMLCTHVMTRMPRHCTVTDIFLEMVVQVFRLGTLVLQILGNASPFLTACAYYMLNPTQKVGAPHDPLLL